MSETVYFFYEIRDIWMCFWDLQSVIKKGMHCQVYYYRQAHNWESLKFVEKSPYFHLALIYGFMYPKMGPGSLLDEYTTL